MAQNKKRTTKILRQLRKYEPLSMSGQPPVIWERAEGVYVFDTEGRRYLDWSSGVLVTNVGHGREEINQAIIDRWSMSGLERVKGMAWKHIEG